MSSVISLWEQKLAVSGQEIFPFQIASILWSGVKVSDFRKITVNIDVIEVFYLRVSSFSIFFFLLYSILCIDTTYIINVSYFLYFSVDP